MMDTQVSMKFAHGHTLLVLALATLLGVGCSEPLPDEARIRQRIEAMSTATADKNLSAVMAPIHEDFLGNQRIRKANLRGLVLIHYQRHKNVHVFVHDVEVKVSGDAAEVTCNVILAGRNELLPEQGRVLKVTSEWTKLDDDWQVVSASWHDPFTPR